MAVNRVVFPIELGGDGMEVTDDDNPSTGLPMAAVFYDSFLR
jgi:hypothetical protein